MAALLLNLLLFLQGIPIAQGQGGTVAGVLRNASGVPAAGVRVSAMAQPDSAQELSSAAALVSIAETDEAGRYRLENVPPGRYYIVAGRVDFPTYYPGAQEMTGGKGPRHHPWRDGFRNRFRDARFERPSSRFRIRITASFCADDRSDSRDRRGWRQGSDVRSRRLHLPTIGIGQRTAEQSERDAIVARVPWFDNRVCRHD